MFDGEAFGAQMVEVVRGYVDAVAAPLLARIEAQERELAELKAREPVAGRDGADADMDALRSHIEGLVADLPTPESDKALDEQAIAEMVSRAVKDAVSEIPLPADGKSVTTADVEPLILELVDKAAEGVRKAQAELIERAVEDAKSRLRDDMTEWHAECQSMSDVEFLSRASLALGKQIEFAQ